MKDIKIKGQLKNLIYLDRKIYAMILVHKSWSQVTLYNSSSITLNACLYFTYVRKIVAYNISKPLTLFVVMILQSDMSQ